MSVLALVLACMSADVVSVPYPTPITAGVIQVVPVSATIGRVPLLGWHEQSEDELLVLKFALRNTSRTKRVTFDGWPRYTITNASNYFGKDEHNNEYRGVTFPWALPAGDDRGKVIEPEGDDRMAVVVLERPIRAAETMLVDLDGAAVGAPGKRLRWTLQRKDWQPK